MRGAVGLGTEVLIVSVGTAVCIVIDAAPNTCLAGTTNAANLRIEDNIIGKESQWLSWSLYAVEDGDPLFFSRVNIISIVGMAVHGYSPQNHRTSEAYLVTATPVTAWDLFERVPLKYVSLQLQSGATAYDKSNEDTLLAPQYTYSCAQVKVLKLYYGTKYSIQIPLGVRRTRLA